MTDLATALAQIAQKARLADEPPSSFRGELYGPSGGGKTVIAAMIMRNLVTDGIILDIDTSEGYVSWANHPGLSDGIVVIPFESIEQLRLIAQGVKEKIPPFDNVRGIILDEGNKMAEIDVIRVNRERQVGKFGEKFQKSAGVVTDGPDYQIALERWREVLFELFDVRDLHIMVCAHQAEKKDTKGNIIGIYPAFTPKINQATKEYMHLVAHLVGTVKADMDNPGQPLYTRVAQVHPTIMVDAKSRTDIRTTQVNADDLPVLIYNWMNSGKAPERAEDVRRPDEPHEETINTGITGELKNPEVEANLEQDPETTPELDLAELEAM